MMLFGETWLGMFGFVGLELLCAFHIVSMDYSIQKDGQIMRCCVVQLQTLKSHMYSPCVN